MKWLDVMDVQMIVTATAGTKRKQLKMLQPDSIPLGRSWMPQHINSSGTDHMNGSATVCLYFLHHTRHDDAAL